MTKQLLGSLVLCFILASSIAYAEKVAYKDINGNWNVIDSNQWKTPPSSARTERVATRSLGFNVVYDDPAGVGFNDATYGATRRATVTAVLNYIGSILKDSGTCDVEFMASQSDASGFLAAAGTFYGVADGFTNGAAFSHIHTGTDVFSTVPDIQCTVDFGWNWNSGTGTPTGTQVDLYSVLLHEMTHGLGLSSLGTATGASQFYASYGTSTFTYWDAKVIRQSSGLYMWSGAPPVFHGTAADMISNNLTFTGANAVTAYATQGGSGNPPIYAPATFADGSSLAHFNTGITGGAVMQPSIGFGVQRRTYAPVDIGALKDIGYSNAAGVDDWSIY